MAARLAARRASHAFMPRALAVLFSSHCELLASSAPHFADGLPEPLPRFEPRGTGSDSVPLGVPFSSTPLVLASPKILNESSSLLLPGNFPLLVLSSNPSSSCPSVQTPQPRTAPVQAAQTSRTGPYLNSKRLHSSSGPGAVPDDVLVTSAVVTRDRVHFRSKGEAGAGAQVSVGLLTLSRPKSLNALCTPMMDQFCEAMAKLQANPAVGAVVVTGQGKAFAAGADIAEMQPHSFASAHSQGLLKQWEASLSAAPKPVIAAVNGYALGGGCELAMMCDVILASETAVFGQPEVTLGVIPGMGGTQRLVRSVGKARAMEMVLGGACFLTAQEAVAAGLASRVVPGGPEAVVEEALSLGARIASLSQPVVALAKQCVNAAFEANLSEGLERERTSFYATFSLKDQKEGMKAFLEKREPEFVHQ